MSGARLRRIMARYPNVRDYPHWQARTAFQRDFREARRTGMLADQWKAPRSPDGFTVTLVILARACPCDPTLRDYVYPWSRIRAKLAAGRRR